MDITQAYAIAVAGIASSFLLVALSGSIVQYGTLLGHAVSKHLVYPFVVDRHALIGPWNVAGITLHLCFLAANIFCLTFRVPSISDAGRRAGMLALINLSPLLLGFHLGFVADLLGLSLQAFRRIHRSVAFMVFCLATFHVITAAATEARPFSKRSSQVFTILVSGNLAFSTAHSLTS